MTQQIWGLDKQSSRQQNQQWFSMMPKENKTDYTNKMKRRKFIDTAFYHCYLHKYLRV